MDEITLPETRHRSRSKTPFTLRSSCDRDLCASLGPDHVHDKKKSPIKKNPTVETITEEKEAPVPVVVQRSTRTKRNNAKIITSDYSSDDGSIIDAVKAISAEAVPIIASIEHNAALVTKTTTVITTSSTKVVKTSAAEQQSSKKEVQASEKIAKISSQAATKTTRSAAKEASQNDSNVQFEHNLKLRTSTPRAAKTNSSAEITNGNGSNLDNLDEHVPFKEYKEAGEYWNKYPKTDYTYSKLSPHRREIKPGIIAMPNMSRRSLEHHHERVTLMSQRDPAKESYFRSRYLSLSSFAKKRPEGAVDSFYDSQDETDLSQFGKNGSGRGISSYYTSSKTTSKTIVRRFITIITTFFTTIYSSASGVFRRSDNTHLYYSRLGQEKGLIKRWASAVWSSVLSVFRYIYLGISTVLFLDSWSLQSADPANRKKKGFLLLLLLLLPLLLLGGTYYYLDKPPPFTIPTSINLNLSLDQVIDPKTIANIKTTTLNGYNNVVDVSSDYLLYLKVLAQNSTAEVQKLWAENIKF